MGLRREGLYSYSGLEKGREKIFKKLSPHSQISAWLTWYKLSELFPNLPNLKKGAWRQLVAEA